jgi:hypothetical protein
MLVKLASNKVGGVGGCAEFYFFHEILFIYNYLGFKKTLALQTMKTKQKSKQS